MDLISLLEIRRGVTALIGGGGKTTLMYTLTDELRTRGSVILCTSTHIRVPGHIDVVTEPDPDRIRELLRLRGAVCVGTPCEESKLCAPRIPYPELSALADYTLVEADGSRGLPLKAHAPHEPVIPEGTGQTILVVGADGFGRPVREMCHRPELYAQLACVSADEPVSPRIAARVIAAEGLGDRVFINKTESGAAKAAARELAALLPCPAAGGSLWEGEYECLC